MIANKFDKYNMMCLSVPLAIGLIAAAALACKTLEKVKEPRRTIEVKGYAQKKITSDMAAWECSFIARAPKLNLAYDKLEKDLKLVLNYFHKNGIEDKAMNVSAVSTSIEYTKTPKGISTNIIDGYVLCRSIKIRSGNVKLLAKLASKSTELIKSGVELVSSKPDYFFTKLNALKIDILGAAAKNAKMRAEKLAGNTGCKVGEPIKARQGVFQVTPLYSTEVSDYGRYDTSTIEKSVKSVVTVEFLVLNSDSNTLLINSDKNKIEKKKTSIWAK